MDSEVAPANSRWKPTTRAGMHAAAWGTATHLHADLKVHAQQQQRILQEQQYTCGVHLAPEHPGHSASLRQALAALRTVARCAATAARPRGPSCRASPAACTL